MKILNTKQCPLCKNSKFISKKVESDILGLKDPFKILKCSKCKLMKLDPQLSNEELDKLYGKGYFDSQNAKKSELTNCELPPNYEDAAKERLSKFENTISTLLKLFINSKKFLDVGAATGDMVHIAQKNGLLADGIEFSDFAIQKAKEKYNLSLMNKPLSDIKKDSYDIVHLNHVFEHFNDPEKELKNLNRIIKNEGCLYIEIPYQFNWFVRMKYFFKPKKDKFTLLSIHHPFFYSPKQIKNLLSKNGFKIISLKVFSFDRYPSEGFLKKIKIICWYFLSTVKIGNWTEIIAIKKTNN